jgi:hypothetical protein
MRIAIVIVLLSTATLYGQSSDSIGWHSYEGKDLVVCDSAMDSEH